MGPHARSDRKVVIRIDRIIRPHRTAADMCGRTRGTAADMNGRERDAETRINRGVDAPIRRTDRTTWSDGMGRMARLAGDNNGWGSCH
jgi:hypothetical protein